MLARSLILAACSLFAAASAVLAADKLERFEFNQPQMGVPFRIVLYAPNAEKAEAAATAAFARVAFLNSMMSDYEDESELTRLSKTSGSGNAIKLSDELWTVLEHAQLIAQKSEGAFDVTVGRCVQLWRRARRQRHLPDPETLRQALQATGYSKLRLNAATKSAELLVAGMRLDLGGIAKGYAADQALAVLRTHHLFRALTAASGDMALGDSPPDREGWRIEIAASDLPDAPPARAVMLKEAAISTSGDLFQRVELEGKRYSHIVDPRTGIGLTDHSLVTVIAADCQTADALATSVSVLGPEKGLLLVQSTAGAEVHIVRDADGTLEVKETEGFARFYER